MIDNRAKNVEQRRSVACPMGVVIGELLAMPRPFKFAFEEFHHGRKDHWPLAPTAEPSIALENLHL